MATERPVTGSCERCARGHDLLIPEPGSGDLDFERIRARFSWCAGCSRIVGRTCCWDGSTGLCPDCAALRAHPDPSLTDVVLTRTALSGLTAAADAMSVLEHRLQQQRVTDEEQASNAWEDAWLETGIGILRADGAVRAARTWGAAASVTPADARWVHHQLATLGATWEERYHAVADRLERVGLRIRALGAMAAPALTTAPADTSPERQRVPLPVGPILSPVTRRTIEPAEVGARPRAPLPLRLPEPAAVASWPPSRRLRTPWLDLPDQPVAGSRRSLPVRPAPPPRLPPSARPTPPPAWERRPVMARPAAARRPAPPPARARTGGRQVVIAPLVLLAVIGLVVTAALAVELLGFAAPPIALPHTGPPATPAETAHSGTLGGTPAGRVSGPPEVVANIGYPEDLARLPTDDQGQSKLWFHDGTWWAILVDPRTGVSRVHRLAEDRRTWVDTGLVVDERVDARADVLWDGTHLYIASGGSHASAADNFRLARYSYGQSAASYVLDSGYPVALTERGVKRATIALDGTGLLWIAYVSGDRIWVNRVGGDPPVLGQAFELPGARPVADDDTAAILAYGGDRIGVMWSNQVENVIYFVSHRDGRNPAAWSRPRAVLEGPGSADDHISARALDSPDGPTIFALVKTSGDVVPGHHPADSQLVLLELRPDGSVGAHQYGRIQDDHTRPLLVIDEEQRVLHMFAVSPVGGGSVYYKQASADDVRLAPGPGAPFLQVEGRSGITSPTSSKQNVNRETDLVVLAADEETSQYVFGVLDLGEAP